MKTFKAGTVREFNSIDSRLMKHSGQKVVIEKVIDKPDDDHDVEVLPMYEVRVQDTTTTFEVFHDELDKTATERKANTTKDLDDLLEEWAVMEPGLWENEDGPKNWYAVSNDQGIVAYFGKEADAFRFRMNEINRVLNP